MFTRPACVRQAVNTAGLLWQHTECAPHSHCIIMAAGKEDMGAITVFLVPQKEGVLVTEQCCNPES